MSDEIDFGQFIELLDKALTSKDPNVQKALKKFLFIASLASDDTPADGPFSNLVKTVEELKRRVDYLELTQSIPHQSPPFYPNSSPNWGPWSTTPGTVSIPSIWQNTSGVWNVPAAGTPCSTTTVSVTSSDSSSASFLGGPSPGASVNFTSFASSVDSKVKESLINKALSDMDTLASGTN